MLEQLANLTILAQVQRPDDVDDAAVAAEREDVLAAPALGAVRSARDPVDDGDALAVPHRTDALDAHAGHEAVHGGQVRVQVLEPGHQAVAIAEADAGRGDAADRRLARGRLGIGPRREPRVRGVAGAGVQAIGDRRREHRQLVAPALDVRIARRDLGERVPQVQPRRRALRLERNRDLRPARLRQLRAGA